MTPPPLTQRLFEALARGSDTAASGPAPFRSGEHLAVQLAVSRSAVWKAAAQLRELGVEIQALPRQGYRLRRRVSLLHPERLRAQLSAASLATLRGADCRWMTGSTNADLLAQGGLEPGQFDVLTAEYQSAGRGRRGRRWLAPPGGAICLSWSYCFDVLPPQSSALSLAVGVTALRALARCGIAGVRLKWPNDLVTEQGKLGGILIELKSESGGPTQLVVGIGLNVSLGGATTRDVAATGNRATDLEALGYQGVDRNALVASLVDCGVAGLREFAGSGFDSFIAEYRAADVLAGEPVTVSGAMQSLDGRAEGIEADGALLVRTADGLQRIVSGDVSVRRAPQPSP
jgi:BirA family biotin operon repressor/biotin-[acetyl-CoA-carboxylase] ligase